MEPEPRSSGMPIVRECSWGHLDYLSIGHATGTSSAVAHHCWHLMTARTVPGMARVQLEQVDGANQDDQVGRAAATCSFLAAAR